MSLGTPVGEAGSPSTGGSVVTFAVGTALGPTPVTTSSNICTSVGGDDGSGPASTAGTAAFGHHQPLNFPAVLKDRTPCNLRPGQGSVRGPPPPVPPRSPKRGNTVDLPAGASVGSTKGDHSARYAILRSSRYGDRV